MAGSRPAGVAARPAGPWLRRPLHEPIRAATSSAGACRITRPCTFICTCRVPAIRTLFGLKTRPHRTRKGGPPAQEIVIEKPRYGLSWFRISFGRLQLKAYTKGEHVLRFEATVHNTKELRCRRSLENFAEIITLLAGMADRFATTLDCADIGFLPDGVLDELPLPARAGPRRIAGIDLNKPRIRAALSAALALAPAPGGFTVAEHAA